MVCRTLYLQSTNKLYILPFRIFPSHLESIGWIVYNCPNRYDDLNFPLWWLHLWTLYVFWSYLTISTHLPLESNLHHRRPTQCHNSRCSQFDYTMDHGVHHQLLTRQLRNTHLNHEHWRWHKSTYVITLAPFWTIWQIVLKSNLRWTNSLGDPNFSQY